LSFDERMHDRFLMAAKNNGILSVLSLVVDVISVHYNYKYF